MTTQQLLDLRPSGDEADPEPILDERSMRIVELAMASIAIVVALLLAVGRA
jgi:hypothetical protein